MHGYADSNDNKRIHDTLKTVHGPQTSGFSPFLGEDRKYLMKEKRQISEGWSEHFSHVHKRPAVITDKRTTRLRAMETNHDLHSLPTDQEVREATK